MKSLIRECRSNTRWSWPCAVKELLSPGKRRHANFKVAHLHSSRSFACQARRDSQQSLDRFFIIAQFISLSLLIINYSFKHRRLPCLLAEFFWRQISARFIGFEKGVSLDCEKHDSRGRPDELNSEPVVLLKTC